MKAYIYKITNPLGKIYIGSTVNLKDRIYRYKTNRVKAQIKISRSIEKYGWENHSFEIIYECNKDEKYFYENKYAIEYNVLSSNGLNCAIPKQNDLYICVSEETRKKIGDGHKGKKLSDEHRKLISHNSKEWLKNNKHPMKGVPAWNKGKSFLSGNKNPMYGIKRNDEWKKNHSERMKLINKKGENHFRSISIINYITGDKYINIIDAANKLNIKYSTLKQILRKKKINKYNLCYIGLQEELMDAVNYIEKLKQIL